MDSLYIIIPAYNEENNIEKCVDDWCSVVENHNDDGESRLVVINDGSKDKTYDLLCSMSEERPLLVPLTKENGGHGSTVLFGYRYAIENGADYIFQTDSDGQTNPEEFEEFWQNREKYDALIGERLERGDGNGRKFVESVACILLKLIFGVSAKDANAPFRLMKSSLVDKYINRLPADFNIPNIMFTTYFLYYNESMKFIPISFEQRVAGKTSINVKKIMRIGVKAVGAFRRFKKDM